MRPQLVLAALLIALLAGSVGWKLAWFMAEDACMDHGGRWVRAGSTCDGASVSR
jgi:hypothetical protein